MAEKIHGIFTPHVVPLQPSGEIDEAELRRYIDWLIEKGVHGLYPNGSTGEFTRFTADERKRIVKIVCEPAAGRVPVLAGAAEANIRETLRACETYAGYGARAVAIVSPFYYRLCPEAVYAYFREIALNSPIDVTLYNIPMFASPIDVPTIRRLAEFDRVIGIKDSSGDMAFMMRMIAAVRPIRPDFVFLTGWDAVLVPMLLIGCDGGTNANAGVVPELTRKLYDLVCAGQIDEAMRLQYPHSRTVRHHALLGRLSRGIPGGGRAARLQGRAKPPAAERKAEDRLSGAAKRAALHPGRLRRGRRARRRLPAANRQHRAGSHQPHRGHGPRDAAATGCPVNEAVGLLEIPGLSATLAAVDAMEKAANVRVLQCELNDFYGVCTKITGKTSDVSIADRGRPPSGRAAAGRAGRRRDPPLRSAGDRRHHRAAGKQSADRAGRCFLSRLSTAARRKRPSHEPREDYRIGFHRDARFHRRVRGDRHGLQGGERRGRRPRETRRRLHHRHHPRRRRGGQRGGRGGQDKVADLGKLIAAHVIPRPSPMVLGLLPKPA